MICPLLKSVTGGTEGMVVPLKLYKARCEHYRDTAEKQQPGIGEKIREED